MSVIRQISLLTAGCQPWHASICTAHGDRFAYAATQAVYVYQYEKQYNEFRLFSIMAEHKKTIAALQWHPSEADILASSGHDCRIIIWNVEKRKIVTSFDTNKHVPLFIGWCLHDKDIMSFMNAFGPVYLWRYSQKNSTPTVLKDCASFNCQVVVMKWHPKKVGKVLFGHEDGSISLYNQNEKHLRHHRLEGIKQDDSNTVVAMEWDPLSLLYFLVAHLYGGFRLMDSSDMRVVSVYLCPSNAVSIRTLAWLPEASGMFVTGDTDTGALRLWNASQNTPLENLRLKETGFHAIQVFNSHCMKRSSNVDSSVNRPHTNLICLFVDGGVGVYDLATRKWNFLKEKGHTETIFDCKFKPSNPDLLATASYDGTIKIWNISTMTHETSLVDSQSIVYSISWAPADLECIAAGSSKNGVFIWNTKKGAIIKRFMQHGDHCVYCVAWNQQDPRKIASTGGDGTCIIQNADGKVVQTYPHPGIVYGCDWMPSKKDIIATGCSDGIVRVFSLTTKDKEPIKTFAGHMSKIFLVKWNPIREGVLCSGADDQSIRVWDFTTGSCLAVLLGHTGNVRGLVWSPEVPFLLLSGSWDSTIRAWDIRDGACLDVAFDHGADVYGLSVNPAQPFVMASCSRDSTVRIWSLLSLTPLLPLQVFVTPSWDGMVGNPERASLLGTRALLCGSQSMHLKSLLSLDNLENKNNALKLTSEFFSHRWGVSNLWDLVEVTQGLDISQLSPNYTKGIMHQKHINKIKASEAEDLEMTTTTKFGRGGLAAPGKEDCLRRAAYLHLRTGNLRKHCELLVQLGQWERALSLASGVSHKYWYKLISRYVKELKSTGSELAIDYLVAMGDVEGLVDTSLYYNQLSEAFQFSVAAKEGQIQPLSLDSFPSTKKTSLNNNDSYTWNVVNSMAEKYFHQGSPVHAACCRLAVDDKKGALQYLIRGFELELAVSVGLALQMHEEVLIALQYLARRCERLGQWELAIQLLQLLPNNELSIWLTCARCAASLTEQNSLHSLANLCPKDSCLESAKYFAENGQTKEAIKLYLLSPDPISGLVLGINQLRAIFQLESWSVDSVWEILQMLGAIRTEKLQETNHESLKLELLFYSAYIGGLKALQRELYSVVNPLLQHAKYLLINNELSNVGDLRDLLEKDLNWCLEFKKIEFRNWESSFNDPCVQCLQRRINSESNSIKGVTIVTGSHLPIHSDMHTCFFTNNVIQGPAFFLEDGQSSISLNDALMWAQVNPFSPLGSGVRINPF